MGDGGMTGQGWVDVFIIVAALLTAWWTIWRRGLRPLIRAVHEIADSVPILAEIAREFRPNGGRLREVIDHIHDETCALRRCLDAHITAEQATLDRLDARHARMEIELRNIQQGQIP